MKDSKIEELKWELSDYPHQLKVANKLNEVIQKVNELSGVHEHNYIHCSHPEHQMNLFCLGCGRRKPKEVDGLHSELETSSEYTRGFQYGLGRAMSVIPQPANPSEDEGAAHWNACRDKMIENLSKELYQ